MKQKLVRYYFSGETIEDMLAKVNKFCDDKSPGNIMDLSYYETLVQVKSSKYTENQGHKDVDIKEEHYQYVFGGVLTYLEEQE